MCSPPVLVAVLATGMTLSGFLPAGRGLAFAQEGTPAADTAAVALPLAPDPALCTAQERPLAEVQAIYAEVNAAAAPVATPEAFVPPEGEPVDAQTAAAIVEVVVGVIRCNANGGSGLADAYYLTDEHLRENLTGLSAEDFAVIYTETPTPLPPEQWLMVYAVDDIRLLPDVRVAANPEIVVPGVGHFRDTLIFEQVDGRWLIDESHEGEPVSLSEDAA